MTKLSKWFLWIGLLFSALYLFACKEDKPPDFEVR